LVAPLFVCSTVWFGATGRDSPKKLILNKKIFQKIINIQKSVFTSHLKTKINKMNKLFRNVRGFGYLLVLASGAAVMTLNNGCSKSSNNNTKPAADTVASATVATAIQNFVSASGGGLAPQTESNAQLVANATMNCGQVSDTTYGDTSSLGGMFTNYRMTTTDTAFCTGTVVSRVDMGLSGFVDMKIQGGVDTSVYFGLATNTHFSISGLNGTATNLVVNETSTAKDTISISDPKTQTSYINMTYSASNITISPTTFMIVSGTATLQMAIVSSTGNSYNQTANITFLGNGQAKLTLSNGYTTTFSW